MVSIIIPVYNCKKTLLKCVDAVKQQTFTDWELLLIDDGSTDGSGEICDRLGVEDRRIRVFHKVNEGVSSARNCGIEAAIGEYVMFCDGDDCVMPTWCEELVTAIQKFPERLPICNYYRNTPSGDYVNREKQCNGLEKKIEKERLFELYQLELLGIPWNKIFRRDILERHLLRFRLDLSLGEDLVFSLEYLMSLSEGFVYINAPLYSYSLGNEGSLSSKYYPDLLRMYIIIFGELKKALCRIPNAFETYEQDYYHSYFFAFDRVFRNTWSKQNCEGSKAKWRFNVAVFSSADFQKCKRVISKKDINILQYWGLKTNLFYVYWSAVEISEFVSRFLNNKLRR